MAVANSNSNNESSIRKFNCYKLASLTKTILDANQTSNLKDRYVLGEELGWGQFGVIRVCSDRLTGEELACKSINKDRLVTQDDVRSVKLEIEIMTRLSGHPNVVDLKAVYEEENYVHLVMELCEGGELFHQLEKHGRFSEGEARVIFRHLMEVVLYCHDKGVVHRDLKPENILLATKSSSSPIKLADFGLATYINPGQSLHGTVGSPFYIAPEVLAGGYDEAADVWSAGVILYILLSGIPPFWGKTKSRIFDAVRTADLRFSSDRWDQISSSAKELVRRMLCKDPSQRLTAREVLDHVWITGSSPLSEIVPYEREDQIRRGIDMPQTSFSTTTTTTFMARNQDISFGISPTIVCDDDDDDEPTFTCKSSFSSSSYSSPVMTPCFDSCGFSFRASLEFSPPPSLSMPSFAFFSSSPVAERGNCALDFSSADPMNKGLETRVMEHKGGEVKWERIHNKRRNHTIGVVVEQQLDLVVTESVIRWASCTNLPTATSLRSSLVC